MVLSNGRLGPGGPLECSPPAVSSPGRAHHGRGPAAPPSTGEETHRRNEWLRMDGWREERIQLRVAASTYLAEEGRCGGGRVVGVARGVVSGGRVVD